MSLRTELFVVSTDANLPGSSKMITICQITLVYDLHPRTQLSNIWAASVIAEENGEEYI